MISELLSHSENAISELKDAKCFICLITDLASLVVNIEQSFRAQTISSVSNLL